MVIDGGVQVDVADPPTALAAGAGGGVSGALTATMLSRPAAMDPPAAPAGIRPSFLTSMWIIAPGWSYS